MSPERFFEISELEIVIMPRRSHKFPKFATLIELDSAGSEIENGDIHAVNVRLNSR